MDAAEMEGGLWRPANATEGNDFEHNWCGHCLEERGEDWEDEFGNHVDGCCPILSHAQCGGQPEDWIVRYGMPWCLAFRQDPERPARCLLTKEMPLGPTPQT